MHAPSPEAATVYVQPNGGSCCGFRYGAESRVRNVAAPTTEIQRFYNKRQLLVGWVDALPCGSRCHKT